MEDYDSSINNESGSNNWGHTIDDDDYGSSDVDSFATQSAGRDEFEAAITNEIDQFQKQRLGDVSLDAAFPQEQEQEPQEIPKPKESAQNNESSRERVEKNSRLVETVNSGLEYRSRLKDPGTISYRMMSIAAAELEEQKFDSPESDISSMVAGLYEQATGKKYEDAHDESAQKVAGIEELVLRPLLEEGTKQISAGVTEVADNPNGNSDKDSKYIVLQWIDDTNMNHILAFSPEQACATYSLVSNDLGSSWRDDFIRAGADANGTERKSIQRTLHKDKALYFDHELSAKNIAGGIASQTYSAMEDNALLGSNPNLLKEAKSKLEKKLAKVFGAFNAEDAHLTKQEQANKLAS